MYVTPSRRPCAFGLCRMQYQSSILILRLPDSLASDLSHLIDEKNAADGNDKEKDTQEALLSYLEVNALTSKDNSAKDRFVVKFQDNEYPGLLVNLPCPIEAQKMFDNSNVLKAGDISQMLIVFKTNRDLETYVTQNSKKSKSSTLTSKSSFSETQHSQNTTVVSRSTVDFTIPSGLSTATENILRKYDLTKPYEVPPIRATSKLTREISNAIKSKPVVDVTGDDDNRRVLELVEEEVVDFEPWMVNAENPDGIEIVFSNRNAESFDTLLRAPDLVEQVLMERDAEDGEQSVSSGVAAIFS
jgi:hypothetical protein